MDGIERIADKTNLSAKTKKIIADEQKLFGKLKIKRKTIELLYTK